jgi:WD40 repeat protein
MPVPSHNRSDDHSDVITAIMSIRKLGLFVTTSRDSTLRVWDMYNTLVRYVETNFTFSYSCALNCAQRDTISGAP